MKRRLLAFVLAGLMAFSLAGCGSDDGASGNGGNSGNSGSEGNAGNSGSEGSAANSGEGKSTDFTYMLSNGISTVYAEDYDDLPAVKYWLDMEFTPAGESVARKVNIDFWTPPVGGEGDFANNLIATGECADVMNIQIANSTAIEMYEDGLTLDITEYVQKYMPNYLAYFDRHPELADRATTYVDGEKRYICLYSIGEKANDAWGGFMYRRDWIVKYGRNPETGAAFAGAWDEEGNWVDDVVFPSGNPDPVYISDWEWMLDIFQTALEDLGIEDGYAFCLGGSGETCAGDLESGFGGASGWYLDPGTGEAVYGTTSDSFRTYIECMSTWYANGWINPHFYEYVNDMFFMVDTASVYSGKVGLWYGLVGSLGGAMDYSNGDTSNPLNGIVVCAAAEPINDVYGDAGVQGMEPFYYYSTGIFGAQLVITKKAEDKDLAALFTALDYLYSEEGSYLKTYGFTGDVMEDVKANYPELAEYYADHNCPDGGFTRVEGENGLEFVSVEELITDSELEGALGLLRVHGLEASQKANPFNTFYRHSLDQYRIYENKGQIGDEITLQMTAEEGKKFGEISANLFPYMQKAVPEFITGERDIHDDAQWESFCSDVMQYEPDAYTDALNRILKGE